MSAADLWVAVKASYETTGLVTLTNIRNRGAVSIDDSVGEDAAQAVIDLWPAYAQEAYDATDALHVEVAKQGVLAVLWRRGGSSATIAEVKWAEVFSPDGLISRVRRTGARGHEGPVSNSGVSQASELSGGRPVRGWSDRESIPNGIMPRRNIAGDY